MPALPESELGLLPELDGLDVVEVACRTGYVSGVARAPRARRIGLDNSGRQLSTARAFQREFDLRFRLSTATPNARLCGMRVSTSRSQSAGPRFGATRTDRSPEPARLLRPGGA